MRHRLIDASGLAFVLACSIGPAVVSRASAEYEVADPNRGQVLYLQCVSCHALTSSDRDKVGPHLAGLVGRRAAAVEGFDYSPALRDSGILWTAAALDRWLEDPSAMVPNNKMAFLGMRDEHDRRDLIAYLERATR